MSDPAEKSPNSRPPIQLPDLRHLTAFQHVYLTRDYTLAGHDMHTSRKGILRMLERLEQTFQSRLFHAEGRGSLVPTPFAERLYNDLRFLNSARESLHDKISEIRKSGRPLRVGASPLIFRSEIFRSVFRSLQSLERVRTSYVPVKPGDGSKALAAGVCDLHVGIGNPDASRFAGESLTDLPFMLFTRAGKPGDDTKSYAVAPDGTTPPSGSENTFIPLDKTTFLRWLDHPEECPAGTRVLAPSIPYDPAYWIAETSPCGGSETVSIRFLRQHPYEFLPSLVRSLKQRIPSR